MENNLDDLQLISDIDKHHQLDTVLNWSHMWNEVIKNDFSFNISLVNPISRLFISGMGGSGVSGELLKVWIEKTVQIPVQLIHDYNLPVYADANSAVICISYSGDTEEVLNFAEEAIRKKITVIGITSGGKLKNKFDKENTPIILLPGGYQPRFALPFMLGGMLIALDLLDLIPLDSQLNSKIYQELHSLSSFYGKEVPFEENPAKKLAHFLFGGLPVILGASSGHAIAVRFKCQLNENSKILAIAEAIPEQNHNGIVALFGDELSSFNPKIVLFQGFSKHSRNLLREEFIIKRANQQKIPIWQIQADTSKNYLHAIIKALYLSDLASVYLAILREVDPSEIEPIIALKSEL
ncbi:MAG: bifunctional phosphoglucose/phosphomannose isomerase [Candidatus Heimdallarchaeota archaeon]|nr:bifunctional phosphoglucose/phosphomannose isomerase [Candidatus Heimdallarchaeota archaeon]MCK5047933.1 bifunctional phosphoglucose/phosphomannose isomerase [Candidatus Heimdallarchaeota archaeon]